jgi:hypothetical protein
MEYSDIIALQDYFHLVFNPQNEAEDCWKLSIPTAQFNISFFFEQHTFHKTPPK